MGLPRFIVAGNWKMNLSLSEAQTMLSALQVPTAGSNDVGVWLAVPAPYLHPLSQCCPEGLTLGAQHAHGAEAGAFTGEHSYTMLHDAGASFTLIGHSERRQFFGETNESATERCLALLSHPFPVVFCIGESLEEREAGTTEAVLRAQLLPLLKALSSEQAASLVVAYEPVWAIGTGKVASLEQIEETHAMIKKLLQSHSFDLPVLYGGSVKPDNFATIAALDAVDGGLIGGASLKAESFQELIAIGFEQAGVA